MIFKIKIRAYNASTTEFNELQDGLRPDTILYTGTAAINTNQFGVSNKKVNKAIKKRFGNHVIYEPLDDNMHIIIWIAFNKAFFTTTHAMGSEEEHTVFHEEPFKKSLSNFMEIINVK